MPKIYFLRFIVIVFAIIGLYITTQHFIEKLFYPKTVTVPLQLVDDLTPYNSSNMLEARAGIDHMTIEKEYFNDSAAAALAKSNMDSLDTIINPIIRTLKDYINLIKAKTGDRVIDSDFINAITLFTNNYGIKREDNKITNIYLYENDKAKCLYNQLSETYTKLTKLVDHSFMQIYYPDKINLNWNEANLSESDWSKLYFKDLPPAAALAYLYKLKDDINYVVIVYLDFAYKNIITPEYDFIEATVSAQSKHVQLGESYVANIQIQFDYFPNRNMSQLLIGPLNKNANKDAYGRFLETNENPVTNPKVINVNGKMGFYSIKAMQIGTFTLSGAVRIRNGYDSPFYFPFSTEYIVDKPCK